MNPVWRLFTRIAYLGVDPSRPRTETKHVVVTNALTMFDVVVLLLVIIGPTFRTLLLPVRLANIAGTFMLLMTFVMNARGHHLAASVNNVFTAQAMFLFISLFEPAASHHELFLTMTAVIAWFVFPSFHRRWSVVATLAAAAEIAVVFGARHDVPQLPTYDAHLIGLGNTLFFVVLIVFVAIYASNQVDRTEAELVLEREKTERRLKAEVSHQVAERSRELGEVIAKTGATTSGRALHAGDRFHGRYKVRGALGEGGMGVVYEVERLTDQERLALKLVSGAVSGPNAARFAREAEIGARVQHPNLVSIVDVGVDDGTPFLVMELVGGRPLEALRDRYGDPGWAMPILQQVADGLTALHEAGVVHRDLKPANVLLGDSGAKISDFGISRFGHITAGNVDVMGPTLAGASPRSALTHTGALIGTPLYMPPEAAGGGRLVEAPGDVFAFGIMAYEILSGRPPFAMPPVLLAMAGHAIPTPAPLAHGPAELLRACLATDPSERPTARAVRDALRAPAS